MSSRCPDLPFLPGFSFNPNLGRTKFNLDPYFDFNEGVPCLKEKVRPNMLGPLTDRFPSVYARGEVQEVPTWIAYDKQMLSFDGFFQETLQEFPSCPFKIRKVKIYFYLEDGTIKVIEPKVENSGIPQGTMISRQRIRFPAPMDDNFYDILDFNVGREVEFYGKVFKITDCDRFTRLFLNRCGIAVPDPITPPDDPYLKIRSHDKDCVLPKKLNIKIDTLGQFLKYDHKKLTFKAYWDDQEGTYGILHNLVVQFYLADDTLDIKEILPDNAGTDSSSMFLRRGKLPKYYKGLQGLGGDEPFTVLNVLGPGLRGGRYIADPLNCGKEVIEYYTDKDFSIGGILNCYGRKIVITDCDDFTKEYYRVKYGLDDFTPAETPKDLNAGIPIHKLFTRKLPPWNGYGTHEDSAQNCVTVELKPLIKNLKKFLTLDRQGLDSHILRFHAKMLSKIEENSTRNFVISFYLCDDTISVFEVAGRNSGFKTSEFFKRAEVLMPGQATFTSEPPLLYKKQHMYVGATLIINSYHFVLINADEYALRYMELHPNEFPKSNIKVVMDKVREKLRPVYKDFIAQYIKNETATITYSDLRSRLCAIMGDEDFTEHEMITISRAFNADCSQEKYDRESIRAITLTELKRFLWDDLDRLLEYFKQRDGNRTGKLSRKDCYGLLRACRLPVDVSLLEKILDVIKKDENCNLYYEDIINFLDRKWCPMYDVVPRNLKSEMWWATERDPEIGNLIDWCGFNKYLDLEESFQVIPGGEPVINEAKQS